jgi:hypothetical protein
MEKPHLYTAETAIALINNALEECDIDQLAQVLTTVVETHGPVIVVHEGCEAKSSAELAAEPSTPSSDVYENGEVVGSLNQDGTILYHKD